MDDAPAPDIDNELKKLLGAHEAASQQAIASTTGLADLLNTFRIRLLVGGMPPEMALDMTRDYFAAMLDRMADSQPDEPEPDA